MSSHVLYHANQCLLTMQYNVMTRKSIEQVYKLDISGGGIPDAMAIHMARKKREAAREAGGRDDFIPINKDGGARYFWD